ncbi:MAG: NfeD family protein [Phycisphaerae bacterium]|jgi:membrane-bound serine protease (ClpP class)
MIRHRRGKAQGRRTKKRSRWPLAGLAGATLLLALPLLASTPARKGGAVVIPIRGEISDIMRDSVSRRLDQAKADGATTVIFEMDTLGGLVTSALDICRLIKNLPADVHTVAWVNDKAYSAGAMISVSCQQIIMSKASSIGDCAPIMVTPTGGLEEMAPTERAKMESPVLQEFRDSAIENGYDPLLLRAMVTVGEEVWWVENPETGERRFVTTEQKAELLGEKKLFTPEGEPPKWQLVEKYTIQRSGGEAREITAKQPVDASGELLTVSQSEAAAYGLASGIASTLDEVGEQLGLQSSPAYLDITGWELFVMWLNSPLVRGILFAIVLIGAYIEFQSPGLILPGATAAVALVIFLAAPFAAGLADVWTFVLLGLGLILLAAEIFVIPGFGVAGILGIALIVIALIGTFVPSEPAPGGPDDAPWFSWPSLPGTWNALQQGIIYLSGSIIIAFIGILLVIRYLPQTAIGRRLIPPNPEHRTLTLNDPRQAVALIGEVGIVTGDLRPGGQARFGQEIVDVQSQGEYVEAGRRVQVLRHEGMRIVVRPLPAEGDSA